eukprot:GHVR01052338.1.p1 GENE.GHVR01052338.1~~GHVR01052338.1.p1  ORF type:complete len:580 (+),score=79.51 GHVR01052338.1:189-1928(+)
MRELGEEESRADLLYYVRHNPCIPDISLIPDTALLVDPAVGGATNIPVQLNKIVKDEKLQKEFDGAMEKELLSWMSLKVLGPRVLKPVQRWVLSMKDKGGVRIPKARLVVMGCFDHREEIESYAPTPSYASQHVVAIFGLTRKLSMAYSDVHTAFLQADLPRDLNLFVRLPDILPPSAATYGFHSGGVYPLLKAAYGLVDSMRLYGSKMDSVSENLGWTMLEDCIYCDVKKDALANPLGANDEIIKNNSKPMACMKGQSARFAVSRFVDDLVCWAKDPVKILSQISKFVDMDAPTTVSDGTSVKLLGLELQKQGHSLFLRQQNYLQPLVESFKRKGKRSLKLVIGDFDPPREEEISLDLVKEYQRGIGRIAWSIATQPKYAVVFSVLSRYSTKPSAALLRVLYTTLVHIYEDASDGLHFERLKTKTPILRIWSDGAYSELHKQARSGGVFQLIDADTDIKSRINIFSWFSKQEKRKVASSTGAELIALSRALKAGHKLGKLIVCLFGEIKIEVKIDSEPLYHQLSSGKSTAEPRLQGLLEYDKQEIAELGATVEVVRTDLELADSLTKIKLINSRVCDV